MIIYCKHTFHDGGTGWGRDMIGYVAESGWKKSLKADFSPNRVRPTDYVLFGSGHVRRFASAVKLPDKNDNIIGTQKSDFGITIAYYNCLRRLGSSNDVSTLISQFLN
jgi:hypothetical protein